MNLRGWDYTGRNIGPELHNQFRKMIDVLSSPQFVNHRTWGTEIQEDIAKVLGVSSSGAIRTIKKIYEMFGFIYSESLTSKTEIDKDKLLTERGKKIYAITKLEFQVISDSYLSDKQKEAAEKEIKKIYEEIYCEALSQYYYTYSDGTHLCPLRATLLALEKYGRLDKWEWYLLNTCVIHDDNESEYQDFYHYVEQ